MEWIIDLIKTGVKWKFQGDFRLWKVRRAKYL